MKYIGSIDFSCRCTSRLFAESSGRRKVFKGLNCEICLEPVVEQRCCCNCFVLNWPGCSTSCNLDGGNDSFDVTFASNDNCEDYDSSPPACTWRATARLNQGISGTLGMFYNTLTSDQTWQLSIGVKLYCSAGIVILTYVLDDPSDFDCRGGELRLDTVDEAVDPSCAGSYPATLILTAGQGCDTPHCNVYCWDSRDTYTLVVSGGVTHPDGTPPGCVNCGALNGSFTLSKILFHSDPDCPSLQCCWASPVFSFCFSDEEPARQSRYILSATSFDCGTGLYTWVLSLLPYCDAAPEITPMLVTSRTSCDPSGSFGGIVGYGYCDGPTSFVIS